MINAERYLWIALFCACVTGCEQAAAPKPTTPNAAATNTQKPSTPPPEEGRVELSNVELNGNDVSVRYHFTKHQPSIIGNYVLVLTPPSGEALEINIDGYRLSQMGSTGDITGMILPGVGGNLHSGFTAHLEVRNKSNPVIISNTARYGDDSNDLDGR